MDLLARHHSTSAIDASPPLPQSTVSEYAAAIHASGRPCREPYGRACACDAAIEAGAKASAEYDPNHPALAHNASFPIISGSSQHVEVQGHQPVRRHLGAAEVAEYLARTATVQLEETGRTTVILLVADYNFRWLLINALVRMNGRSIARKHVPRPFQSCPSFYSFVPLIVQHLTLYFGLTS